MAQFIKACSVLFLGFAKYFVAEVQKWLKVTCPVISSLVNCDAGEK